MPAVQEALKTSAALRGPELVFFPRVLEVAAEGASVQAQYREEFRCRGGGAVGRSEEVAAGAAAIGGKLGAAGREVGNDDRRTGRSVPVQVRNGANGEKD